MVNNDQSMKIMFNIVNNIIKSKLYKINYYKFNAQKKWSYFMIGTYLNYIFQFEFKGQYSYEQSESKI